MVQLESVGVGQEHFFAEPLLVAVELGVRSQGAVGYHREQSPLQRLARGMGLHGVAQDAIDAQLLPQMVQRVGAAIRPGIQDAHIRLRGESFLGGQEAEDAMGQTLELFWIELVGTAEVVDDPSGRSALVLVPGVLGELVVVDGGAVAVLTLCAT